MTPDLILFPVVIVGIAVNALIMYAIIRVAVTHAMRRARREEWTETYDAKRAVWLHESQRQTLAGQAQQVD